MSNFEEEIKELFDRYGVHMVIDEDRVLKLRDKDGNVVPLPKTLFDLTSYTDEITLTFENR